MRLVQLMGAEVFELSILKRSLVVFVVLVAGGCVGDPVGDPCIPESVPTNGFLPTDTYLETNSPQCESRLCMVRGLTGDPRPSCVGDGCASELEVRERVYCTRRCEHDGGCPEGYVCADLGGLGLACARDLI